MLREVDILDEIPGIGRQVAEVIIAENGLDITKWPTAGHMVSWAKLSPKTIQSGNKNTSGKTGKGNRYLKAVLGVNAGAGKTKTRRSSASVAAASCDDWAS